MILFRSSSGRRILKTGLFLGLGTSFAMASRDIRVADYPVIFAKDDFPKGASVHLPSLTVTAKGTVLALCQFRKQSDQDWAHDIDLLLRRSLDGGKTWEPVRVIFTEPGVNTVNGEIVLDRSTDEIILPFTQIPARVGTQAGWVDHFVRTGSSLWLTRSRDDGRTWSKPREAKPRGPPGWSAWPSNSGHGIQLPSGRLVIGAFVHKPAPFPRETQELDYCSGLLYSDDHGASWRIGATTPFNGTDELAISETSAGDIYANVRLNNRSPMDLVRFYARSRNDGETFDETGLVGDMSVVNCHVGLTRWRRDGRDILLYSGPCGPGGHMHRTNLTLRLSYDGGRTWPVARKLTGPEDSSEYSDLAMAADGAILCLYGEHTFEPKARSVMRLIRLQLDTVELTYGPRD